MADEVKAIEDVELSCSNQYLGLKDKTGTTKRTFATKEAEDLLELQNKQGKQRWKLTDSKAKLTKDGKIISK